MTLSATELGRHYDLTAQEMNYLLKEEGYLLGEPNHYYPAEKGKQFAFEKLGSNGYGGYAYKGWNWLVWDESIMDELDVSWEYAKVIRKRMAEERRRRKEELYSDNINSDIDECNSSTDNLSNMSAIRAIAVSVASLLGLGIYGLVKNRKNH